MGAEASNQLDDITSSATRFRHVWRPHPLHPVGAAVLVCYFNIKVRDLRGCPCPTQSLMSNSEEHLSRIETIWTQIDQAHGADSVEARCGVDAMIRSYSGAVYRYLMALLRNRDAADEVFQQFALAVAEGRFKRANPEKGRFRDYLKTSIIRLARDHDRAKNREPLVMGDETLLGLPEQDPAKEPDFDASYREELLARTWARLKEESESKYRLLHYRAAHQTRQLRRLDTRCPRGGLRWRQLRFARHCSGQESNSVTF